MVKPQKKAEECRVTSVKGRGIYPSTPDPRPSSFRICIPCPFWEREKKKDRRPASQNANFGHRHHKLAAPLSILRLLRDDFIGKIPSEQKHVVRLIGQ
jgi:hypothetical protein